MRYEFHQESNQHLLFAPLSITQDPNGPVQLLGFSKNFWGLRDEVSQWLKTQHLSAKHFSQIEFTEDGSKEICFRFDTKDQAWEFKLRWG